MNNFLARHERSRSPRRYRNVSPRTGKEYIRAKKGTLNVINGGFVVEGERSNAREVYASQISKTALVGKKGRWSSLFPNTKGNM